MLGARLAIATVVFGAALTGCVNDEPEGAPDGDPTSAAPTPTESSPTETTPAWQAKYSKKEIAAYEAASDRFASYEQRSEPIWRKGEATPAAEQLFKEYFYGWQNQLSRLRLYEEANVEVHGTPTVLESRPTRIALSKRGEGVTVRQCIDWSTSELLQNGEQAPGAPDGPRLRQIELGRSVGEKPMPWRMLAIKTFEGKRRC